MLKKSRKITTFRPASPRSPLPPPPPPSWRCSTTQRNSSARESFPHQDRKLWVNYQLPQPVQGTAGKSSQIRPTKTNAEEMYRVRNKKSKPLISTPAAGVTVFPEACPCRQTQQVSPLTKPTANTATVNPLQISPIFAQ